MEKLKFNNFLASLLFVCFFSFCTPSFAAETGWFRVENYYRPYVKVENFLNKQVLFITNDGLVYTGRCRKKKAFYNYCYIVPGKKFKSVDGGITYIVLKIDGYYSPRVIEYGTIDNFNVKLKDEK
jgi:hypothetical protein